MPGRLQFKDNETARRAMRAISRRIDEEIRKLRPESRVATVTAINPLDDSCKVLFRNDTQELTARMGAARPWQVGQFVRIGRNQRRQLWVEDVIGKSRNWVPGDLKMTGLSQTYMAANYPEWLLCDGSAYDPTVDVDLWNAIGTSYGGTASAPLLPNLTNAFPRGNRNGGGGGQDSHSHSFDDGGHTHGFNDGGHTHGPGSLYAQISMNASDIHLNSVATGFTADTTKTISGAISGSTGSTKATNVAGTSGSTNASGTTGNTHASGTTGITTSYPPYVGVNYYIKR